MVRLSDAGLSASLAENTSASATAIMPSGSGGSGEIFTALTSKLAAVSASLVLAGGGGSAALVHTSNADQVPRAARQAKSLAVAAAHPSPRRASAGVTAPTPAHSTAASHTGSGTAKGQEFGFEPAQASRPTSPGAEEFSTSDARASGSGSASQVEEEFFPVSSSASPAPAPVPSRESSSGHEPDSGAGEFDLGG